MGLTERECPKCGSIVSTYIGICGLCGDQLPDDPKPEASTMTTPTGTYSPVVPSGFGYTYVPYRGRVGGGNINVSTAEIDYNYEKERTR